MKTKLRTTAAFLAVLILSLISTLARPVTAAPFSAQNPGTADLAAWWTLDEIIGERADSLAASNLADNGAVGYSSGLIGNSADLESDSTQFLSVADNASLSSGDVDFTFGAWIKPESASATDYSAVLAKGSMNSADALEYALFIYSERAYFLISNGSQYTSIISNDTIQPGSWYFILAWHDSAADQIGIQVNNSTPDVGTWSYGSWDSDLAFSIGSDSNPGSYFDGMVDEAFLYKRTLTEDEREWLLNAGQGRTYSELLSAPTATPTATTSETNTTLTATAPIQGSATPGLVTVIQTVIVTVPYIIIENGNSNDVAESGGSSAGGTDGSTAGSFYAATPYPWQNVYSTGSTSCGGYSISVRVYVDYNEDKMMSPSEGVTDLQIFFLDQSYSRLGSTYTQAGQAVFCISPTLYGRTVYIDIPYLQKFNELQIPNEPKQDLEIWFAGEAPELPLFLP